MNIDRVMVLYRKHVTFIVTQVPKHGCSHVCVGVGTSRTLNYVHLLSLLAKVNQEMFTRYDKKTYEVANLFTILGKKSWTANNQNTCWYWK